MDRVVKHFALDCLPLLILLKVFGVYFGSALRKESSVVFVDQICRLLLHAAMINLIYGIISGAFRKPEEAREGERGDPDYSI